MDLTNLMCEAFIGILIILIKKIIKIFYRDPDMIIGRSGPDIYLRRWYVIPRNPIFNIYLHNFLMSDVDNYLHTHPWIFNISFLLNGSYLEHLPKNTNDWFLNKSREEIVVKRYPFIPIFRFGYAIHRIELLKDNKLKLRPIWTIFITGPVIRSWFFVCPWGFRDHKEFLKSTDESISVTGRGCD